MLHQSNVTHLLKADYAVYTKAQYGENLAGPLSSGPDFIHCSAAFEPSFLDRLRPTEEIQDTAGFFLVENEARQDGAWMVSSIEDKIVLSNLCSRNLHPVHALEPTAWDAAQRHEFVQQISVIFDRRLWGLYASELLLQGREWIMTTRQQLAGDARLTLQPVHFHVTGKESYQAYPRDCHAMKTALEAINENVAWLGHENTFSRSLCFDFLAALLRMLCADKRETLEFGIGFVQRIDGFDIQILRGRSLDLTGLTSQTGQDLRHQIKMLARSELLDSQQDVWHFLAASLAPVLPHWSHRAHQMSLFGPEHPAHLNLDKQSICITLDLYDLALDCVKPGTRISACISRDLQCLFSMWLRHYGFLSGAIWRRVASLIQVPFIIGGLFDSDTRSVRLALHRNLQYVALSEEGDMGWKRITQTLRCPSNWRLTHWEATRQNNLDLSAFCRHVESIIETTDLRFVSATDLMDAVLKAARLIHNSGAAEKSAFRDALSDHRLGPMAPVKRSEAKSKVIKLFQSG